MLNKIKSIGMAALVVVCFFFMGFNILKGSERQQQIKVSFWGTNIPYMNAMQEIVDTYNEYQNEYEVVLSREDAGNYRTWMSAQLAGGNASDVLMTTPTYADTDAMNGYLCDLTEYLEEANPYNEEDEPWMDTFAGSYLTQVQDTNNPGQWNCIPTSTVSVRIVINKEMLSARNIPIPDENWTFSDFRKICEVFENEGKLGMEISNGKYISYMVSWMTDIFLAQVMYDEINEWDINENMMIDAQEIARTFLSDDVGFNIQSHDKYKSVMQFIKTWSKYWNNDFNSNDDTSENFLRQDIPMMFSGSWGVAGIELTLNNENPDATSPYEKFDYVSLPFPKLEETVYLSATESYTFSGLRSDIPLQELGEPSDCYCIPASVEENGKLDAVMDFLYFLSSREAAEILANTSYSIPVLTGVEIDPIMQDYVPPKKSESIKMRFGLQKLADGTAEEYHFKQMQDYLKDELSLTSLCKNVQKKYVDVTSLLSEDNEWEF